MKHERNKEELQVNKKLEVNSKRNNRKENIDIEDILFLNCDKKSGGISRLISGKASQPDPSDAISATT